MDLRDSPDEALFREQLRDWLRTRLPPAGAVHPGPGRLDRAAAQAWSKALHAGSAGLTWPAEYAGAGRSANFQGIFLEESTAMGAPEHIGVIGLGMVGPTILAHGTPAQKQHYRARWIAGFDTSVTTCRAELAAPLFAAPEPN